MYSNNLICDILIYIDDNISNKITIEDLENKFFYNRYYIMKLFKKGMGITLINYINSIRIYNSITLIKESNNSLLNIAFKCGFYSIEYFSETFKKIIGVNPEIVKAKGTQECDEGCLSFPNQFAKVVRPKELTVKALDENGKEITIKGEGLLAQCLCHELNHLDGILFVDLMEPGTLEYLEPNKEYLYKEYLRKI